LEQQHAAEQVEAASEAASSLSRLGHFCEQTTAKSNVRPTNFEHRVTRTGMIASKLLEFGWIQRPLWIRRVLVRAQEGQCPVQLHRAFSWGTLAVLYQQHEITHLQP
jgi:hypothetical protein